MSSIFSISLLAVHVAQAERAECRSRARLARCRRSCRLIASMTCRIGERLDQMIFRHGTEMKRWKDTPDRLGG